MTSAVGKTRLGASASASASAGDVGLSTLLERGTFSSTSQ